MLRVRNLDIGYRGKTLRGGISFDASQGECILLCGANGTGKSTLLRTLAGVLPPISSEEFEISGSTALIPTGVPKVKGFSVREFVRTGLYRESGWAWRLDRDAEQRLESTISLLNLEEIASTDISKISDGQFQKACIATALVRRPDNILLDEPTAFLDPDNRIMILSTLKDIAHNGACTVLFSSHDIHDSLAYADSAICFSPYMKLFETFSEKVSYL